MDLKPYNKKVLILGITGQYGAYLVESLLKKGYKAVSNVDLSCLIRKDRSLYQDLKRMSRLNCIIEI
ncbi:GDP-mannose 4,6-dehydratase [Christiangramia antarctica]|uniref:GDP-mannose 4,6-dehydratase n=1 Tax=Christiangramia antarctica TaxID=2058158 RepID=A0ABW5X550_9FLAO|nr:hypothetical protein [Gramella sp. AN32]